MSRLVVFENPSLPHQIVIRVGANATQLVVSCNCQRRPSGSHEPIEIRTAWTTEEAISVWLDAHLVLAGVA